MGESSTPFHNLLLKGRWRILEGVRLCPTVRLDIFPFRKGIIVYGSKLNLNVKVKENDTSFAALISKVVRHISFHVSVLLLSNVERF